MDRLMPAYPEYEAREMVVQKRLNRGPVAPSPLNAIIAIVQLLWLLVKWLARVIWAGFKWLRRFLGGERQVL